MRTNAVEKKQWPDEKKKERNDEENRSKTGATDSVSFQIQ